MTRYLHVEAFSVMREGKQDLLTFLLVADTGRKPARALRILLACDCDGECLDESTKGLEVSAGADELKDIPVQ